MKLNPINTKKQNILILSFIGSVFFLLSYFNEALRMPYWFDSFCCSDDIRFNIFFIFIPILVFSIILIKKDIKFYTMWWKFTCIYLLIYLLIYLIAPSSHDYINLQKEIVSFWIGGILYSLVSIKYIFKK